MSKHTKGTWSEDGLWYLTTSSGSPVTFQVIEGGNRKVACVMMDTGEIDSWEEMEANARLIATAPELLEACKKALPTLHGLLCEVWGHPDDWPKDRSGYAVWKELQDAINKAEGGNSC